MTPEWSSSRPRPGAARPRWCVWPNDWATWATRSCGTILLPRKRKFPIATLPRRTSLRRSCAKSSRILFQGLQDTLAAVDPAQYKMAVEALVAAKGLAFFGLGNAAVVAREAYHKFLRIGVPCHTAEDPDLQLIILRNHLTRGDVMAAISYSGESKPILAAVRAAQARGIRVLAITNFPRSSLAKSADMVLLTAVFQEHVNGEIGSSAWLNSPCWRASTSITCCAAGLASARPWPRRMRPSAPIRTVSLIP